MTHLSSGSFASANVWHYLTLFTSQPSSHKLFPKASKHNKLLDCLGTRHVSPWAWSVLGLILGKEGFWPRFDTSNVVAYEADIRSCRVDLASFHFSLSRGHATYARLSWLATYIKGTSIQAMHHHYMPCSLTLERSTVILSLSAKIVLDCVLSHLRWSPVIPVCAIVPVGIPQSTYPSSTQKSFNPF